MEHIINELIGAIFDLARFSHWGMILHHSYLGHNAALRQHLAALHRAARWITNYLLGR